MNNIKSLSELVLIGKDIKQSGEFYKDIVGLSVEKSSVDWVWFYIGSPESKQRLALHRGKLLFEEKSPLPEGKRFGQIHFAFEVEKSNLDKAIEKVRNNGIEVFGPQRFDWMNAVSYYFYDLDGNLIEYWSPDN